MEMCITGYCVMDNSVHRTWKIKVQLSHVLQTELPTTPWNSQLYDISTNPNLGKIKTFGFFHNACACGIHPFHSVFLQKQIFCRLRKTLHICKAFLFSFCPLHRTFSFCKIHFTKLHLPFCKISFSPDKFQLLFLYPMIQIFYYSLCPISDTVHFLNPFPLIFMLLFICTELYQIKRNKKDMIS